MKKKILIVEDEFVVANDLRIILQEAAYDVCGIARSCNEALGIIDRHQPELVLLDIYLKGDQTGIDLAQLLAEKNIAFVYLSANNNETVFEKAKATQPYGFLVKPFRKKDVLIALDIAHYRHAHNVEINLRKEQAMQAALTEQLKREKNYLQEEVKTTSNFEEIIGSSYNMLHVFDLVSQVAPMQTSVLLLGESGTGKELVARAIHNLSPGKDKLLVKVNCAALPANLIESELFGHEKGAFTGAIDKHIGKFELAQGGTIFLDEIGEMPIDLQSKLLRVLQEKEIERIGGRQTIKIDVRIIAATNRNLEKEIAAGKFRMDLYYRLNVFPITLPPLRERREDIPLLANFFAQKFSRKTGKPFNGIKPEALAEMMQYNWPGNIREMENVMEQAFVLNNGKSPLQWGRPLINDIAISTPGNLVEVKELQQATERAYILSILQQTNGRIRGIGGAAEKLNMKPTTLESRMEKLGIKKTHI